MVFTEMELRIAEHQVNLRNTLNERSVLRDVALYLAGIEVRGYSQIGISCSLGRGRSEELISAPVCFDVTFPVCCGFLCPNPIHPLLHFHKLMQKRWHANSLPSF